jgi:hypothetical protein
MKSNVKTHFICTPYAKEILLTLLGLQSLAITIDCYIESTYI